MHPFSRARVGLARTNERQRPGSPLMPWLAVERFEYERLEHRSTVVRLLANRDVGLGAPAGAMLVVQNGKLKRTHAAFGCDTRGRRGDGRLWRASFVVPLDVVEFPDALFTLTADDRVAIALPAPEAVPVNLRDVGRGRRGGARIRRHVVAIAAGLAIAATSGSAVAMAAAETTMSDPSGTPTTTTVASGATTDEQPDPTVDTTTTQATTNAPETTTAPPPSITSKATTPTPAPAATAPTPTPPPPTATAPTPAPPVPPQPAQHLSTKTVSNVTSLPRPDHPGHHQHRGAHSHDPHTDHKPAHHGQAGPQVHHHHASPKGKVHREQPTARHPSPSHNHHHPSGTATTVTLAPPATIIEPTAPIAPTALTPGFNPNPLQASELSQLSSLLARGNQPPAFLIPIYKAAARRYHVPWQILAAINWIETDFGRNLNTSSAGAVGWMQFMPGTWQEYGVAADGNGQPNPYNPQDSIFSAAHYLAANGAEQNLPKAIFAYNHAAWYVAEVIWRAQIISDHSDASTDTSLAGTGRTGLAGAETMLVAAFSAVGGPYSQANHDSFGQTAMELRRAGTDCSGFVSWVLNQVDPGFGNQTTVTLPDQPGILPGVGQYVTMWDRPLPGNQGHVIINILGTWFESGGNSAYNSAGGISPMSEAQAVGELTGGGFLPYHLKGL